MATPEVLQCHQPFGDNGSVPPVVSGAGASFSEVKITKQAPPPQVGRGDKKRREGDRERWSALGAICPQAAARGRNLIESWRRLPKISSG